MVQSTVPQPEFTISVIILAGGESRRLGRDKSLLELDGQPLIARTVHTLTALSDDLVVVTNNATRYQGLALPARYVPDEERGMGSLMGLYSGLKAIQHSHALAVACDMPFLNLPLLRYMLPLAQNYDVVIPKLGDFLEPLHALYGRACLPPMARLLAQGRRQILAFFPEVRTHYVAEAEIDRYDPLHLSFVNVNTPEEWARAQALLSGGSS